MGPETARWGGGLPRERVVAEKFVPSLESLSYLGFEERDLGCPGNFAGMSRTPGGVRKVCRRLKLISAELESGNAIGAFLQTPAPALDKISGPMGAPFLSSTGLGSGKLIGRAQFPPAPALDKNRSPSLCKKTRKVRALLSNPPKSFIKLPFGPRKGFYKTTLRIFSGYF